MSGEFFEKQAANVVLTIRTSFFKVRGFFCTVLKSEVAFESMIIFIYDTFLYVILNFLNQGESALV